jgi:hypothetical protein
MITINSQKEMEKYYVKESNTYVFNDNVKFKCNIYVSGNIDADNINARNINAGNIYAGDINAGNIIANNINAGDIIACNINACDIIADDIYAGDINAGDIRYYAVCCSYNNIKCKSIQGTRNNCKHFCLDGKITYKTDTKEMTVAEISKELGYDIKIVKE